MKTRYLLSLVIPLILLTGCQAMGRHFKYMGECDKEVANIIPPNLVQKIARYETHCSGGGSGTVDRFGSVSTRNSSNCTTTPIYETVDLNYQKRIQLRNECIANKKRNNY